jgi:hypothetical protein
MKIQFFDQTIPDFPLGLFILWAIIWLAVLYRILSRRDLDTLQKILWLLAVVLIPFFGVPFYWFAAPASPVDFSGKDYSGKGGPLSDVANTPWAADPGHTSEK